MGVIWTFFVDIILVIKHLVNFATDQVFTIHVTMSFVLYFLRPVWKKVETGFMTSIFIFC